MNDVFKLVRQDKIAKWGFTISNIFVVIEVIAIAIFYFSLPPFLPVFNQLPWGETRLGIKPAIFIPIAITMSFIAINFFLVGHLYEKTPLLSRILSITTLLIALLSFIFILRTLYLLI